MKSFARKTDSGLLDAEEDRLQVRRETNEQDKHLDTIADALNDLQRIGEVGFKLCMYCIADIPMLGVCNRLGELADSSRLSAILSQHSDRLIRTADQMLGGAAGNAW